MQLLGKYEHSEEALSGWQKLAGAGRYKSASLPTGGRFAPQTRKEVHAMREKDSPFPGNVV